MKNKLRIYDPWLFAFALIATGLGLLFIFDAGYARAIQTQKVGLPPEFQSQILFLLVSGVVCYWTAGRSADSVKKGSKMIWILNLVLLALVMVAGHRLNGARRWIGYGPLMIQPAEFAKLAAIIYLAGYFADRKAWPTNIQRQKNFALTLDNIWLPKLKRCLPAVWVFLAVILVEVEPDMGTGFVVAATGFAMFFPAGVTKKSIVAAIGIAIVAAGGAVLKEPYRMQRFTHHASRWTDENFDDTEFQTVQSELAIASGGPLGAGIGAGRAKHVMPATTTDFIWATIGEESGLWGSFLVLGSLAAIVFRLLHLAKRAENRFKMLVLSGIAFWIGIQTCVNVMMANALLPAIGIPLPFISSGGSSLVALWMAIGICQATLAPVRIKKEKVLKAAKGAKGAKGAKSPAQLPTTPPYRGVSPTSKLSRREVTASKETRRPVAKP